MTKTPQYTEETYEYTEKEFKELIGIEDNKTLITIRIINNDRIHKIIVTATKGSLEPEMKKKTGGYT